MFTLNAPFHPTGDQPRAIEQLVARIEQRSRDSVLLGVTGSGKTFTVANVIARVQRPTLVISHNKTLAGQLFQEFRDFFPDNSVNYFISYYDYYQPEAYIPQTDTYIEKETEVNDLIDKMRLETTTNLLTRKDVIVVASVSCIYNLGAPSEYERNILVLTVGVRLERRSLLLQLTNLQYRRNEIEFTRGTFRVRGDTIDIWPAYDDHAVRMVLTDDDISSIAWIDPISSSPITNNKSPITSFVLYPAKHYLTNPDQYGPVFHVIRKDLATRVKELESNGRLVEAHRLKQRVEYDLEMIQEIGYVNGIENYSWYFDGRKRGEPPHTLLSYMHRCDPNFLTIIDESHMTVPQLRGMVRGDRSRKQTLIEYGFRLPAAIDNRPLSFSEFRERTGQTIYTSATPDEWEMEEAKKDYGLRTTDYGIEKAVVGSRSTVDGIVEQLIRPTGLIDPEVEIRQLERQVPDLVIEILKRKKVGERVLATTMTKKTAEELAEYLNDKKKIDDIMNRYQKEVHQAPGVRPEDSAPRGTRYQLPSVTYLHADVATLDRQDTLDKLRRGDVDVIVGINLLREGLDLPEVSLVAILDADQEGFLRSRTSLIQTMGRAARHVNGRVILYAHTVTGSMQAAIAEVNRRRQIQIEYNLKHNIFPQSITKPIRKQLIDRPVESASSVELPGEIAKKYRVERLSDLEITSLTPKDRKGLIRHLTKQMISAADRLDFESAAALRDKIQEIKG